MVGSWVREVYVFVCVCMYVCTYVLYRQVLGPWSPHSIPADPETAYCNRTNMAMTAEEKKKEKGGWE